LAATVTVTVPDPVPLVGLTVAHAALLVAVQPQELLVADTLTLLVVVVAAAESAVADNP
jgi:NADH:ubiquinone oxidoreductase subunit K